MLDHATERRRRRRRMPPLRADRKGPVTAEPGDRCRRLSPPISRSRWPASLASRHSGRVIDAVSESLRTAGGEPGASLTSSVKGRHDYFNFHINHGRRR